MAWHGTGGCPQAERSRAQLGHSEALRTVGSGAEPATNPVQETAEGGGRDSSDEQRQGDLERKRMAAWTLAQAEKRRRRFYDQAYDGENGILEATRCGLFLRGFVSTR